MDPFDELNKLRMLLANETWTEILGEHNIQLIDPAKGLTQKVK